MLNLSAVILLVIVLAQTAKSQFPEKLMQNPCVSKVTCRECIQTKSCAWCLLPDYGDKPRCFDPSLSSLTGGCPKEYIWNPDNEVHVKIAEELTRAGSISGGGQRISGGSYEASSSRDSSSSSSYSSNTYSRQRENSSGSSRKGYSSNTQFGSYESSGKIVQIYPQRVGLKLKISRSTVIFVYRKSRINHCFFFFFFWD